YFHVTGVQTCALPILRAADHQQGARGGDRTETGDIDRQFLTLRTRQAGMDMSEHVSAFLARRLAETLAGQCVTLGVAVVEFHGFQGPIPGGGSERSGGLPRTPASDAAGRSGGWRGRRSPPG